jgi:hypothetical protein
MTPTIELREALGARTLLAASALAFAAALPARGQAGCGEWTQVAPPAGATLSVSEIAVRSANDAFAFAIPLGLIHWDGAAWSQFPIDDPNGSYPTVWIDRFGLVGPSHLFLAGRGDTGPFSNDQVLKIWDGTSWSDWHSLTLQPNIMGAPRNGAANVVVGAAVDDVWLLGSASGSGSGVGGSPLLTVHWDGSELTEVMTPGFGTYSNQINDAVAFAGDDIWAVGRFRTLGMPGSDYHGAIYHWGGSAWDYVPNPTETSFQATEFNTVAGVATDDVWAAGSNGAQPLFAHWDGSSWSVVPGPATTGTIQEMVAIASDDVWAVDSPAQVPLIGKFYHWDGVSWSIVSPQSIPGATNVSRHAGLAAVGPCDVWAVGSIDFGSGIGPFIERLEPGDCSSSSLVGYCTAGTSASGCQSTLSSTGLASASAPSGFVVTANATEGNVAGQFFWGTNGRQAAPWGTGTSFQCVAPPVKRGGLIPPSGTDGSCDGQPSQDLNARWSLKPNQNPGAGATVQIQYWYRDPFNTSNQTTSLSDGGEFTVCP